MNQVETTVRHSVVTERKKRKRKFNFVPYIFLLPAIVLLSTFEYLPTINAFYYSFTEYHVLAPPEWIGIENYRTMMNDDKFWKALGNSMKYFLITVPMIIILPLFLAILVNRKLKGINFFRLIYYLPVVTAMVAVAIMWKYLYHPSGLINAFLQGIGFENADINWLLNTNAAIPAISILEAWKAMGFYMLIYLAGLQAVSKDLIEAARIDGASPIKILWHVYLPQLRPVFAVTLVMATLGTIQMFTSIYIMTGGGPLDSTMSLPLYIYQKAFVELDMGYATAMGMVLWVILMILTVINYKISRGGHSVQ
ncbi:carbohydrate ABC transporter permease [Pseudalkalibacillus decolorationis]|uniref:carbohydrate ABC transporter permease n=1 Tax=Pseudalkalibacillus decolorationis TaxID=163879 RepID=UPI0021496E36|nr:sugar ABC transporter permease [Pseudalkalibacillus decolorationis]